MKKRTVIWILLLAFAVSLLPTGAMAVEEPSDPPAAEEESPDISPNVPPSEEPTEAPDESPAPSPSGMAAFLPSDEAPAPHFTDVPEGIWFDAAATLLYRLGLVRGMDEHTFAPDRMLTAGECAALSVRVYALYHDLSTDLTPIGDELWHAPYLRAAVQYGIMPEGWDGDAVLTRAQALYLTFRTLPESELAPLRTCVRVPGLYPIHPQYDEILCLYNAGVLSGMDEYGTLDGDSSITRAQYITLLARLVDPTQRSSAPLLQKLGMDAFNAENTDKTHPFTDIPAGSYFDQSVGMLYHTGLVNGIGPQTYAPDNNVTILQTAILAVRVYELYHGLANAPRTYDPDAYLVLAREYGILPESWTDTDRSATRAEVAYLIAHTLPAEAFPAIRKINSIPDVSEGAPYYTEILMLYRAGIVAGSDPAGTFNGGNPITRAEFAAMFARVVDPAQRKRVDLSPVEDAMRSAIASYYGDWSVFLLDVDSGESVSINPKRMWSASIVKLYVMGAVMEALENGTLANSDTIQNQLRAMITWSSNDAWKYLATRLGGGNYNAGMMMVNDWCDRNGYPNSGRRFMSGNANTTSAEDTGLFLLRVLQGTNVSANASAQMLSLLKQQQRTSKIPAGIPSGVVTANKTGELNTVQNDAAIIFAPYGTYILVVLTENGYIPQIRSFSTLVYNAMQAARS